MAIVASYDLENDTLVTYPSSTDTRVIWREAVATVADKAKTALPACNGRVDKAASIVLAGDVELLTDGHTRVASQSHGQTTYAIVNGECTCKDFSKAPDGWCKHRLAAAIHKRATVLATAAVQAQDPKPDPDLVSEADASKPDLISMPQVTLPEAPASCNVRLTIHGREVQVTLRDADESRLLVRLQALLSQFPVVQAQEQVPAATPWCKVHGVTLRQQQKNGRTWYSHKAPDGSWCQGK